MATWEDIRDGRRLSEPVVVTVTDTEVSKGDYLDCVLNVEDKNERGFKIQIWSTHDIDHEWKIGYRYELNEVLGKIRSDGTRLLSSTADLEITDLGVTEDNQIIKLLAISDTHFGYKHRDNYPRDWHADADGVASFQRAARLAIRRDVDGIIHAGDVFDDKGTVTDDDISRLHNIIYQLHHHFIPVYYILGNHETVRGSEILEGGEIAGETVHLSPEGQQIQDSSVYLYGIGRNVSSNPSFTPNIPPSQDTVTNILVMHHNLAPVRKNGDVDLNRITANGPEFDFVISGDLHDSECHWWGDTKVLYTGATDHISRIDEENNPSAWLLTICNGDIDLERCPLDSVT